MFYLLKITEYIFLYLQKNYNWQNHNKHSISSKEKRIRQKKGKKKGKKWQLVAKLKHAESTRVHPFSLNIIFAYVIFSSRYFTFFIHYRLDRPELHQRGHFWTKKTRNYIDSAKPSNKKILTQNPGKRRGQN